MEEAKKRADFDLRWKVALGVEVDDRPFTTSTLQEFRAQLLIHDKAQSILARTLELAKEKGVLRKRHVRMALDSTMVLGRGAVKDTYNLIGDGIVKLCRALASVSQSPVESWASGHGYERYFGSSLKGEAGIDWDDEEARQSFLTSIISDGERLLELAREARSELEAGCAEDVEIAEAAEGGPTHRQEDGPTRAPTGYGGLMTVVKAITGLFRSLTSHRKTSEPITAHCALT